MPEGASILHADLDSFYASVEQRDHPALRGRPVIVGGGVVLAASYEARACGVHTAMGGGEARRLCPRAVIVPPRFQAYSAASEAVFAIFHDTTPLVEGVSIDEAFLDVGGLAAIAGTPVEIADRLRREVRARVGLAITVGIARTKFLAKVASRVGKPDGLLLVEPDRERAFLDPLPVQLLWGVGAKTAAKLHRRGIYTVAELIEVDRGALISMLGRASGRQVHALARNQDPRPVHTGQRRRSIGAQHALGRRRHTAADLDAQLVALTDRVSQRLRAAGRLCRTTVLRLRFEDFTKISRSHTLPEPTADTLTLLAAERRLLGAAMPLIRERGITLIGVTLANLDGAEAVQLTLPLRPMQAATGALDAAVDGVHARFGSAALTRAVLLGRERRDTPPLPPGALGLPLGALGRAAE